MGVNTSHKSQFNPPALDGARRAGCEAPNLKMAVPSEALEP